MAKTVQSRRVQQQPLVTTVTSHGTWPRFLRGVTTAQALVLLGVAGWLTDLEAGAIAVGFVVGLALLRFRTGLSGRVLLTLLNLDVLAWMALGLTTNLATRQGGVAVALPAALTATSVLGLVAAIVTLSAAARTRMSKTPAMLGMAGLVAVATALVVGVVTAGSTAGAGDLSITAADVRFSSTELTHEPGQVTVTFDNRDLFWHTFTIDELDVDLAVPVKGERTVTFVAAPGSYTYYCRIPGHEALMSGTLVIGG